MAGPTSCWHVPPQPPWLGRAAAWAEEPKVQHDEGQGMPTQRLEQHKARGTQRALRSLRTHPYPAARSNSCRSSTTASASAPSRPCRSSIVRSAMADRTPAQARGVDEALRRWWGPGALECSCTHMGVLGPATAARQYCEPATTDLRQNDPRPGTGAHHSHACVHTRAPCTRTWPAAPLQGSRPPMRAGEVWGMLFAQLSAHPLCTPNGAHPSLTLHRLWRDPKALQLFFYLVPGQLLNLQGGVGMHARGGCEGVCE